MIDIGRTKSHIDISLVLETHRHKLNYSMQGEQMDRTLIRYNHCVWNVQISFETFDEQFGENSCFLRFG